MRVGLRARVVAVLACVSALTLAVAAFTLLSPLEHQLRRAALTSFAQSLHNERGALASLPARQVTVGDRHLLRVAHVLARHNGAEVAVLTPGGRVLVSTDPDRNDPFTTASAVARTGRMQRAIHGSAAPVEAEVAFPLTIDGRSVIVAGRKSLESVDDAGAVVSRAFTVAAAAGLAAALLTGLLLAGRLAWRVRRLRDTALRVAEIGPDAELRPDRGRDEIGDLSRAFATMQDKLREQERARRAFVATASHELRTPLASLSVMIDMLSQDLEEGSVDLAGARLQASNAETQVERLASLAAELLDLSRIDAGIPLRVELVEISAVLSSVVAELSVRLGERDRSLEVAEGPAIWAVGDPGSVAQILRVLLDNALRHTPAGGRIHARSEITGDGDVIVEVRDNGLGVPEADRERIFQRFERGSGATDGGFGLGLAIGRELARRMDGDLTLEPPGGGGGRGGACFVLRLPGAERP